MKKVYAVVYNGSAVSQEAYNNVEDAIKFIESRTVAKELGWSWMDQNGNTYQIYELTVK